MVLWLTISTIVAGIVILALHLDPLLGIMIGGIVGALTIHTMKPPG